MNKRNLRVEKEKKLQQVIGELIRLRMPDIKKFE